jgi:hypothetical protein
VVGGLARVRQLAHALVSIALAVAIAGILLVVRPGVSVSRTVPVGAQTPPSPAQAMTTAASLLEATTAKGGPGYTFEILQRSTMHARAGGPQIEIPDPTASHKSLGFADT